MGRKTGRLGDWETRRLGDWEWLVLLFSSSPRSPSLPVWSALRDDDLRLRARGGFAAIVRRDHARFHGLPAVKPLRVASRILEAALVSATPYRRPR